MTINIFLIKCKVCKKQHVGETTNAFWLMWDNYQDYDRKFQRNECSMQQHLDKHFSGKGYNKSSGNISASLTTKADVFQTKKKENCAMETLKTLTPLEIYFESAV